MQVVLDLATATFLFAVSLALPLIPARVAWRKHRSFFLWYLFGLVLFIPAVLGALVVHDRSFEDLAKRAWGNDWQNVLVKQRETPSDAGWYVDRSNECALRWWDGSQWTNAWFRVDGLNLPRPLGSDPWSERETCLRERWSQVEVAANSA